MALVIYSGKNTIILTAKEKRLEYVKVTDLMYNPLKGADRWFGKIKLKDTEYVVTVYFGKKNRVIKYGYTIYIYVHGQDTKSKRAGIFTHRRFFSSGTITIDGIDISGIIVNSGNMNNRALFMLNNITDVKSLRMDKKEINTLLEHGFSLADIAMDEEFNANFREDT